MLPVPILILYMGDFEGNPRDGLTIFLDSILTK